MTPLEQRNANLDKAKDLILTLGWTQGEYARDNTGMPCSLLSAYVSCLCARGAIMRVIRQEADMREYNSPEMLAWELAVSGLLAHGRSDIDYNDEPGRTKYEVAALFDHAKEIPL
jgi:hypothetical protein